MRAGFKGWTVRGYVKPIFTLLLHRCPPAAMFEYRGGAMSAQATNPRLTARVFLSGAIPGKM
jgi:hypothetical protein